MGLTCSSPQDFPGPDVNDKIIVPPRQDVKLSAHGESQNEVKFVSAQTGAEFAQNSNQMDQVIELLQAILSRQRETQENK